LLLSCYRPAAAPRPRVIEVDLSQTAYDALSNRAGVILVVEPRSGRILRRVGRGSDVQFASSPFEIAEIVTAYAALSAGIINERTLLACDESGAQTDITAALARSCRSFFAELSKRLTPAAFAQAANVVGFTYYGIESPNERASVTRPILAKLPAQASGDEFAALAARGEGMEANDLHFAQLVSSLASGTTAAERFAAYIATAARAPAPPAVSFNRQALAVVRRGLLKAVEEGEAKAAAQIDQKVAGKLGGGAGQALFISYAPASDPQVGLVVYLKDAVARDAAEVAGKFYQAYFKK
jgi:cell division protein FtsI/penicillin-binding protein 2